MKKLRAHILRKLIATFLNWHRNGVCRFPVLCMYDDLLCFDLSYNRKNGGNGHATWREARHMRQEMDRALDDYISSGGRGGRRRRQLPDETEVMIAQIYPPP